MTAENQTERTRPTVSVAMATYFGERYITAQLESIAGGTWLPDELVICEDGSTDNTAELIEAFAKTSPFPVRLIRHRANRGTLAAFETAISNTTGEIIVLSDQDDEWYPTRIERLITEMMARPEAPLAFSDADLIDRSGRHLGTFWPMVGVSDAHIDAMESDPLPLLISRPMVSGCAMAFRRETLEFLLPFPRIEFGLFGPFVHDRWMSLAIAALGPFVVLPDTLLAYRLHSTQQIGVPQRQLRRIIPPPLRKWRQVFVRRAEQCQRLEVDRRHLVVMRQRLSDNPRYATACATLDQAITHLDTRITLPDRRIRRIFRVVSEYRTGRYDRFGLGPASAAADLVRR